MTEISILLLDNNERFLQSTVEYLEEQAFIGTVLSSSRDSEALRLAEKNFPTIILLDILMPGKNGIDLIKQFKDRSPTSKIIMLTLWDLNGYREMAASAGADAFVTKKNITNSLLPVIKQIL